MPDLIKIAIIIHASLGGLALLSGSITLAVTKGSPIHRKFGKVFFYSMLISSTLAMVIACLPNHNNPFLFGVGIFSNYLIIKAYRALKLKNKKPALFPDKIISFSLFLAGVLMLVLPFMLGNAFNIVLAAFGTASIIFSISDFRRYRANEILGKRYLGHHIGNMLGGYISAWTAFIVVNSILPFPWGWFAPSIVGTFAIIYFLRKHVPN